jgi:hypothetical protein
MTKVAGLFREMQPWLGYGSVVGKLQPPNVHLLADEPSGVQLNEPERW